jgi:uncharacterized protein YcgI (DUF1989 family)
MNIVSAGTGVGIHLQRGEQLRVIDPEGGQSGDLLIASRDGRERLSNGRTFDYGGKIYVSTGDVLLSDRSNALASIVHDDVGKHDFLITSPVPASAPNSLPTSSRRPAKTPAPSVPWSS